MGELFMTVYVVGQLRFTDRAAYERYAARFRDVLKQFGGRLLAADEQPEIIEGRWDRDKIVLLSFQMRRLSAGSSSQPNIGRLQRTERWERIPFCCWCTALTVAAADSAPQEWSDE
jgi:uncharacterized protein (DUF1330 family)